MPLVRSGHHHKPKKPKPPTKTQRAKEIGERIDAHLQRIEHDPKLNPSKHYDKKTDRWIVDKTGTGIRAFYNASARGIGTRVYVIYVSYQGGSFIDLDVAEAYLAWLDAGNVGNHYQFRIQTNGKS